MSPALLLSLEVALAIQILRFHVTFKVVFALSGKHGGKEGSHYYTMLLVGWLFL